MTFWIGARSAAIGAFLGLGLSFGAVKLGEYYARQNDRTKPSDLVAADDELTVLTVGTCYRDQAYKGLPEDPDLVVVVTAVGEQLVRVEDSDGDGYYRDADIFKKTMMKVKCPEDNDAI